MRNFIGVDLGGTNIRAAIVSEDGTIKCMKKSESHPERGAEAVMETMISLIESLDGYEECEGGMVQCNVDERREIVEQREQDHQK